MMRQHKMILPFRPLNPPEGDLFSFIKYLTDSISIFLAPLRGVGGLGKDIPEI
jgi:hypothetical protein